MSEVKLSVVIATCDRPRYLAEAVDSVLAQTVPPHEIIVIDNGRDAVKLDTFEDRKSVKLVRALPRFGVSQARNLGVILSTGTHVAFLDDDDKWDRRYLEAVKQAIAESNPDIVLGRLRSLASGLSITGKQAEFSGRESLIRSLMKRNPGAGGSNTIVRRGMFMTTSGFDPWLTTGEDKALVLDLLLIGATVARADEAWANVREEGGRERMTDIQKRLEGKVRFTRRYWKQMKWHPRLFNLAYVGRLLSERLVSSRP